MGVVSVESKLALIAYWLI